MAVGDTPGDSSTRRVSVESRPDGGVRFDDRIDRRTFTVRTADAVTPEPVSDSPFRYPTDVAVSFVADRLELAPTGSVFVHGPDTSREIELFDTESFPAGRFVVEISGPLKVYVELQGPFTAENMVDEVRVELARPGSVVVGARSYHNRPATTVTTTQDPHDVMAAVSTFGVEIMTDSSKRSYSTLRGHPPALAVGDELAIPPDLDQADGAVRLQVPPDLESVLAVAPLSYYLGAPVEPASNPSLVVDGTSHPLDDAGGLEATVERHLKRTLFLDCLVRTATKRDVMLAERERLEPDLDIDIPGLQGRPAAERLSAYTGVTFETIEPYLPQWKLTAHVQPTTAGIEALPYLVDQLAILRVPDGSGVVDGPAATHSDGDRNGGIDITSAVGDREIVRPPAADSVEQAWVGPGVPVGASKAMPTAYRNRLSRERREREAAVEVAVVCNDETMLEEGATARNAYGSNQHLPFDVDFHTGLDADGLRLLFESDLDYVHYVGHVGEGGFECTDGTLDIATLDGVGVDIAFLNACRSYEQGFKLIDKGAIASVVTFGEVLDDGALRIGSTMAGLLDQGFPLNRALSIARARSIVGSQYLVLGDGDADISQAGHLIPWVSEVDTRDDGTYRVEITPYLTQSVGMGAQFHPAVGEDPSVHLVPRTLPAETVTTTELREYLEFGTFPVIFDGEFTWSGDALERL